MRLFFTIARKNPRRSAILFICIVLGGLADGIGASSLVPFISQAAAASGVGGVETSSVERTIREVLTSIGLEPTMGVFLALVVGAILLKALLLLIANRQIGYCVAHTATDLRLELLRALLRTRWAYYVHQPIGSFANSMATEALRAAESYLCAATIASFLVDATISFVVALMVSWRAGLLALAAAAAVATGLRRLIRRSKRAGAQQTRYARSLLSRLTDIMQGIKPLKAMSREMLVAPLLESDTQLLNRALEKSVVSKAAMRAIQDSMVLLLMAVGLYAAIIWGQLPLPTVITLALLSQRIIGSGGKIQKEYQKLVIDESAFWSMRAMIEQADGQRETLVGQGEPALTRAITLDGVDFAYESEDRWILRGASLELAVGDISVIVGPSGAGKTTIADLIVGLIQPQAGRVLVDDQLLSDIDAVKWRTNIGYVPQETFLLHDTVRMNVSLGDPSVSDADVEEALRAAGVWDVIGELPEGIATVVGERGLRFSGGQRQRIAMARALVRRPRLLILDEATTALDPTTELGICATLRGLRKDIAIVAICHQGALIDEADRVYRLAEGAVTVLRDRGEVRRVAAG